MLLISSGSSPSNLYAFATFGCHLLSLGAIDTVIVVVLVIDVVVVAIVAITVLVSRRHRRC